MNDRRKKSILRKSNQHFSPHITFSFFRIIAHKLRVLHVCTSILSSFFSPPLFSLNVIFTICTHHHVGPSYVSVFFFLHKTKQRKRTLHAKHETSVPSFFDSYFYKKKNYYINIKNLLLFLRLLFYLIAKESKER